MDLGINADRLVGPNDGETNTCNIGGNTYTCNGFTGCQDVCAQVNDARQALFCKGVTFAGNEQNCFLKNQIPGDNAPGCGVYEPYPVDSAGIELQGYPYS